MITCSIRSGRISVSRLTPSRCCVEIRTVDNLTGRPSTYSKVTWVFPSGRRYGMSPLLRTSVRRSARRCANQIGRGMRSGVSLQAYPNIIPWSPAPWPLMMSSPLFPLRCSSLMSTPCAMSGLCASSATTTPQVFPSKPYAASS